jgi:hypothetical protein
MTDLDLDRLASELAEFAPSEKKVGPTAREERMIAGFEEIQGFVDEHGRVVGDNYPCRSTTTIFAG